MLWSPFSFARRREGTVTWAHAESGARRGLAWAQLVASHFLLFNLAKLRYVRVVAMHCVVPSARLTHVCGHTLVLATSNQ